MRAAAPRGSEPARTQTCSFGLLLGRGQGAGGPRPGRNWNLPIISAARKVSELFPGQAAVSSGTHAALDPGRKGPAACTP